MTSFFRSAKILIILFSFSCSWQLFANGNECIDCHESETHAWGGSDHAKAMAPATENNVLGDFDNATATHLSQTARFYKKGRVYWADHGYEDKLTSYKIIYTFGHFPLQQYLIDNGKGKYQVFPFSWDSRKKEDGGQRWYANYLDEDILPNDRLHWLQPLQTWNGMCADCHSDGLERKFSIKDNSFNTTWDNINVGCQSCHGKMETHAKEPKQHHKKTKQKFSNQWLIAAGTPTAKWQGKTRDNTFMDSCFACHSLRSPLTDGIKHDKAFLDQFSPSLLQSNLYHPDGQIKEEVYVYGSFLQSKMFKAGVNCLDCHDQHTMKIKLPDNTLCSQCHNSEIFDTPKHHGHKDTSTGSQCVNCHMPETRYMGVDDRRDHSFKIPRPHLSDEFNTPNACVQCHDKKDNTWATSSIKKWHGEPKPLTRSEKTFIHLQQGIAVPLENHLALINDTESNAIVRATAITLLVNSTANLTMQVAKPWTQSSEPLIRLAIARSGLLIPSNERAQLFNALLTDKYKAIRAAAANTLLTVKGINSDVLQKAYKELTLSNEISSWRGEGNLNQSMAHLALGENNKALASLKKAIEVDPFFPASYINLADLYRNMGKNILEKQTYLEAIKAVPNSDILHYSYGLYQIRLKDYNAAITAFSKALKLQPTNGQYAYIYILALDSTGQTQKALAQLKMISSKFSNNAQMMQLGVSLSQKMQDQQAYKYFSSKFQRLQYK